MIARVSDTQIMIVLAASVAVVIIFVGITLVVIARLRRVVKSQFEALDGLLTTLRDAQGRDKPGEDPQGRSHS